ncbi:MAG: hypothetical protein LUF35_01955 [Lachnospiraceae bacterium]|nr:hypothetical protein [Lachnospiraceae bacterium]
MSDLTYRSFLLSGREFMVLSAFMGIERVHMLIEQQPELPDRKELSLTLFGLYQKGLLCWENGICGPKPEIRSLFRDIRSSEKELQVFHRKENAPLLCYWDESSVLTELSENDRDRIRLHGLRKNDLLEELKERGILPEKDSSLAGDYMVSAMGDDMTAAAGNSRTSAMGNDVSSPVEDAVLSGTEEPGSRLLEKCPELMRDGEIQYVRLQELFEKENELETAITIHNRSRGEDECVILILDCGLFDGMVLVNGGTIRMEYYSQESLSGLLA